MPADTDSIPAAIADYRILGVLGEGNNGRFYLAEPPTRLGLSTDRVAVKVFTAPVSTDAYRRGVRELRAFAAVPSVLDLPVAMGIREARPDQPAVYVLNERAGRVGGRPSGPKVVELNPDATGAIASEQQGSGARIIHLAVPVGTAP